jgi:hypothetical protein
MAPDINVQGNKVTVVTRDEHDFISLTDMAKHKNPAEFSSIRNESGRHEMDPPKFIPCNFKPKVCN